ncbi:hypothetical protein HY407_02015 [Candidatus Gottesmanbacteria bacterium]|nr:hypothetical protein [Candidatus Gottesmanbacteria bacterium]
MKKNTYILLGIIFLMLIGGLFSYGKQNNLQQKISQPTITFAPTMSGQVYRDNKYGLSFHYPVNYILKNTTRENGNHLLFLVLTPPFKQSYEGIQVVIFPLKNRTTLEDWISSYTTPNNTANLTSTAARSYLIDQVHDLQYTNIEGRKVAVFTQGDPNTVDSAQVTLLMGKSYLVYIAQQKSLVGSDYQKILSSIAF